jgi:hypothetical protein
MDKWEDAISVCRNFGDCQILMNFNPWWTTQTLILLSEKVSFGLKIVMAFIGHRRLKLISQTALFGLGITSRNLDRNQCLFHFTLIL